MCSGAFAVSIVVEENQNGYYTIEAVMENGTQAITMYTI